MVCHKRVGSSHLEFRVADLFPQSWGSFDTKCADDVKASLLGEIAGFSFSQGVLQDLVQLQTLRYSNEIVASFLEDAIKIMTAKTLVEAITCRFSKNFSNNELGGPAYLFVQGISEAIALCVLTDISNGHKNMEGDYDQIRFSDGISIKVPPYKLDPSLSKKLETPQSFLGSVKDKFPSASVFVVTGLPGVGKTTLSRALAKTLSFKIVELDRDVKKDRSERVPSHFGRAHLLGYDQYDATQLNSKIQGIDGGVVVDGVCARALLDQMKEGCVERDKICFIHVKSGDFEQRFSRKFSQKEEAGGWYGQAMNLNVMLGALYAQKEGVVGHEAAQYADVLVDNVTSWGKEPLFG